MDNKKKQLLRTPLTDEVRKASDRLSAQREASYNFIRDRLTGDVVMFDGGDQSYYVYRMYKEAIGGPIAIYEVSELFLDLVPVDFRTNKHNRYILKVGHMDSAASRLVLVSTKDKE